MTFVELLVNDPDRDPDRAYVEEQMRLEEAGKMSRTELYAFYGEGGSLDHMDEIGYEEEDE